jgi:hypothetical protein
MRRDRARTYALSMRSETFLTTDVEAVRAEHLAAYRRLTAALERQGGELSETGWRLFSRIASCLYSDAHTIDEITPLWTILDGGRPSSPPSAQ